MEDSQKQKFHMWTADEDKLLVECLMQLKTEQRYMADNGFKSGYANRLEAMILERQPDSEIKGNPHILSRIKTMKLAWQVVYDMVYGPNTSGFGWDPDRQCVVADKEVWDEYIKVHKRAGTYRNKCLPHFQDMCFVWSKDRAVGDYCKSPKGMVEEIYEEEEEVIPESPIHVETTPEFHVPPVGNHAHGAGGECFGSARKKRKTGKNDTVADVLRETMSSLDATIERVFDNLGARLSRDSHHAKMQVKEAELFQHLLEVPGLTVEELTTAHIKIVSSQQLLNSFEQIPTAFKEAWIRALLGT